MNKKLSDRLKGMAAVPLGLIIILVPFSMLIGWNLITLILFWFVLTPALTIFLPPLVSKNKGHLTESLTGLAFFYALMVFMIYDHYKTDYFQMMIASAAINLMLVLVITWVKTPKVQG